MVMPGRTYVKSGGDYRFGFQGQEKNSDLSGVDGGHLDFQFRIHDARLGRFLSVDPLYASYPWNSTYAFAENKVIRFIDLEGAESYDYMKKIEHEEGETKLEYAKNWTLNRLISLINIIPTVNNNITIFLWEGPQGNIDYFNEGLDNASLGIAQDMIEAKESGEFETGTDYVTTRAKDPEVWGMAVDIFLLNRMFKAFNSPKPSFKVSIPKSTFAGFTEAESAIISETSSILKSPGMDVLRKAYANGTSAEVQIGTRTILYEPGLKSSGFSLAGENGFVIGAEGFSSSAELTKTVLHEIYRIEQTSVGITGSASAASASTSTQSAFSFAEKAAPLVK
jgi:RHS repeat-associated protein